MVRNGERSCDGGMRGFPGPRSGLATTIDRRQFLRAGAGVVLLGTTGCGGDGEDNPTAPPLPGTPVGPVPGFDDPGRWAGRTLRVGAWGGEVQAALRRAMWQPFSTATGCVIDELTTDYSQLTAAIARGQPYADLLLVDPFWAETAPARGEVEPLDPAVVDAAAVAAFGGGAASVPAFAYALVSSYRRDAVADDGAPRSWAEWWDVERFPGARALERNPFGTFEFALLADGVPPERLYPLDGERAIERLKAVSGKIVDRWWDSGAQPVAWLGTERADLVSSWHYRVIAGQQDGLAVDLVWNQGLVVTDRWVVPTGATAGDVATDFLRYAATPEAQAALAQTVPLGPVNPAAFRFLDPRTAATLPTAPANLPRLLQPDIAWWTANRGEAVQRFNAWLLGTTDG